MKIKNKILKDYTITILKFIFLTNIVSLLLFWKNFHIWLGFLLGSVAGSLNLYFQAKGTEKNTRFSPGYAKSSVFKNFYMRYLILFAVLILIIKLLPVNIIALLAGVVSLYVVILVHGLLFGFRKNKA